MYSAVEYSDQVLCISAQVKSVYTQLHSVMRMISGTVKLTQLQWLPVLTNMAPLPDLRRKEKLIRTIKNVEDRKSSLLINK